MQYYTRDATYTKLKNSVSLIEYHSHHDLTHFSSNFAIEYYVNNIKLNKHYRTMHLSSFIFDLDRLKYILNKTIDGFSPSDIKDNVLVWQCLSLSEIDEIISQTCKQRAEQNEELFDLIVIEDLDEAFNICSFEDYIIGMLLFFVKKKKRINGTL